MRARASTERLRARRQKLLQDLDRVARQYEAQGLESFRTRRDRLEHELDELDGRLMQAELTAALETDTAAREAARLDQESATFWFRRFMLSLQIGNGAGFLATAAVVGQVDSAAIPLAAVLAWAPATYFGLGTAAAGLLPLVMAARASAKDRPAARRFANIGTWLLTTLAVGLFACGMTSVVVELRELGRPKIDSTHGATSASSEPAANAGDL